MRGTHSCFEAFKMEDVTAWSTMNELVATERKRRSQNDPAGVKRALPNCCQRQYTCSKVLTFASSKLYRANHSSELGVEFKVANTLAKK